VRVEHVRGARFSFEASEVGLRPGEEPTGFVHAGIVFRDAAAFYSSEWSESNRLAGWHLTSDDGDVLTIFND
jgi:hypothetical protein